MDRYFRIQRHLDARRVDLTRTWRAIASHVAQHGYADDAELHTVTPCVNDAFYQIVLALDVRAEQRGDAHLRHLILELLLCFNYPLKNEVR